MIKPLFGFDKSRISPLAALLAVLILALSFASAALLPIYVDEFVWRFAHRAAIDGGVDIAGSDICGPNTIAYPPWFMMPVRWFSAVTNQALATPGLVRATGVACAAAWLALLAYLIRRLFPDRSDRLRQATLAAGLLGLGWLPWLMVMSRPEQPIVLTSILVVLLALAPPAERAGAAWLRGLAMLVLVEIVLSYHPKGVLYSGIALVGIFVTAQGRATLLPRLVCMAAVVAMAGWAFHYWAARLACPNDPILADLAAKANLAGLLARGAGHLELADQLLTGLNPATYVKLIIPNNWPMSQWLPNGLFPERPLPWLGRGIKVGWCFAVLLTSVRVARLLFTRRAALLAEPRFLVGAAVAGCVMVWGCSQINRNVYEAAHMLPMLLLALLILNAIKLPPVRWWDPLEQAFPVILLPVAAVSQVFVLWHVQPALLQAFARPGYLPAQPYSTSLVGYTGVTRDIDRAMAKAGFPAGLRRRHLLLDGVSYLYLQDTFQPFERQAVLGPMNGTITDPVGYLRSRGSDGVVVGCRYLPPDMLRLASRAGEICAIRFPTPK